MITPRAISACLLLAALALGTLSDALHERAPVILGGYRVLAADFHVHSFPLSGSNLAPWDIVMEARRQGLDAIALTGHDNVWEGRAGRWFSSRFGGPLVLVGEEIHAPGHHVIAVGIHRTISWRLSAAAAIDEVHAQGGIAIAAHPLAGSWPAFAAAMGKLDGTEVVQPTALESEENTAQLRQFYERARAAAIGSSDYHGAGPLGVCRTYVFSRSATEQGILEALRAGRTVVFDRGRIVGDPALIRLAQQDGRLAEPPTPPPGQGLLAALSRTCGLLGLSGIVFFGFRASANGAVPQTGQHSRHSHSARSRGGRGGHAEKTVIEPPSP